MQIPPIPNSPRKIRDRHLINPAVAPRAWSSHPLARSQHHDRRHGPAVAASRVRFAIAAGASGDRVLDRWGLNIQRQAQPALAFRAHGPTAQGVMDRRAQPCGPWLFLAQSGDLTDS